MKWVISVLTLIIISAVSTSITLAPPELALSSTATKDCIKVADVVIARNTPPRIIESSTSLAIQSAAITAKKSHVASKLIESGAGDARLLGVFQTIRSNDRDIDFACHYSAAQSGPKFIGAKLISVTMNYLPVDNHIIDRWPEFDIGYWQRAQHLIPINGITVTHLQ